MRYIYPIVLLIFIAAACNPKATNETPEAEDSVVTIQPDSAAVNLVLKHYENKEIVPFSHNKSKNIFSGTFIVSPDYYTEISLDVETGYFRIYVNGEESPCDLKFSGYPADLQTGGLNILQEDYNEDGLMDFRLIPNSGDSYGSLYLFDKDKKCFSPAPVDDYKALKKDIGNTVGFITFPEPGEKDGLKDKAQILNGDKSVWMSFYIDYFRHNQEWKNNFSPWAFEPGIGVFVVRCTKINSDSYTIVVNEALGLEKNLKKNPNITFSTVEEHILNAPILDFNREDNPPRKSPNDNAEIIPVDSEAEGDEFLHAVEMKGDWVKLEDSLSNEVLGWVRWRKGSLFMVEIYYSV